MRAFIVTCALCLLSSSGALASTVYYFGYGSDTWSIYGTFTTDGDTGALQASDVLDWDLVVTPPFTSLIPNPPPEVALNSRLLAVAIRVLESSPSLEFAPDNGPNRVAVPPPSCPGFVPIGGASLLRGLRYTSNMRDAHRIRE